MFYSLLLLSRKGALGSVWVAAHCPKRLKKDQVQQTDISSSVDKILDDEVPVVTYRILAYLLLGVVRIYSKKVEYLVHDCNDVLNKLHDFKIGKRAHAGVGIRSTSYHSVTLPKRFELDAFDLELVENRDVGGRKRNLRNRKIRLDGQDGNNTSRDSLHKQEKESFSQTCSALRTPPRDAVSPQNMDLDVSISSSHDVENSIASIEVLRGNSFSLLNHLDHTTLHEAEKQEMTDRSTNENLRVNFHTVNHDTEMYSFSRPSFDRIDSALSMETNRGSLFSLEDQLAPLVLDEAEKEQINLSSSNENLTLIACEMACTHVTSPSRDRSDLLTNTEIVDGSGLSTENCDEPSECRIEEDEEDRRTGTNFQEDKSLALVSSTDMTESVKTKKSAQLMTPESINWQESCAPIKPVSVYVTADLQLPGAVTPEVAAVQTPALVERSKLLKKRKVILDHSTMLPTKVYKNWLNDPRDLICKRRKVPQDLLHGWRERKLCNIHEALLEPLIPCASADQSVEIDSIFCKKYNYLEPTVTGRELCTSRNNVSSPDMLDVQKQIPDIQSPGEHMFEEQAPIAPETPVAHLEGLRLHEIGKGLNSNLLELEPTSSLESPEKFPLFTNERELMIAYPDLEINSSEEDFQQRVADIYSARTRSIGRYLYQNFLHKKVHKDHEVLNLSRLLSGKAKKESSRLFYEILVLKTGNFIDVRQDEPYHDILLQETPKLMQFAETDDCRDAAASVSTMQRQALQCQETS